MTVTAHLYGAAALGLPQATFDFAADTFKIMLTTSGYTPDVDTHTYRADVTDEITGTGYSAGGLVLTGFAWSYAGWVASLAVDTPVWTTATFTARVAVVYKDTGSGATSPLLCFVDFGADRSPAAEDFGVDFGDGLLGLGVG